MKMVYTGNLPDAPGRYMVVDTISDTNQFTSLYADADGRWWVWLLRSHNPELLNAFVQRGQKWFFISELQTEDFTFIRRELSASIA